MIKAIKGLALLAAVGMMACKEAPPPVDLTGGAEMTLDTTYVVDQAPIIQQKGILIEDLTGVRCVNCPDAADKARDLKASNPSRVVVAGLYTSQPDNLTFPHGGEPDLRTDEATNLYSNMYGSQPLPGGGVNRKLFAGQSQINQQFANWGSSVSQELPLFSVVNIDTNSMQVIGDTIELTLSATFNEAVKERVFVSLMLLENEIIAPQTGSHGVDSNYVHEHVLREMYTPYNGSPIYTNAESGRYVQVSFKLAIPDFVDQNHASLVIILNVNEEESKEILHVKEFKL